ncbi:PEP-CTERM sorting domain-containing protein [Microcystis aeruginosa LEGE 11464]|uniref:PEP-CTERM sorting domain-containing protein n=1 Tax=Microcystis aeruginosa TaxID=1126 RepID=UPI00187E2181|nr:PEP-CTERM sorting domain-containing protein [Microcystis aeruginosa]MBE9091811.1 PEP-CTERM sorting domain-containing protein [Microcystis aeruginosa LEGE 11464]
MLDLAVRGDHTQLLGKAEITANPKYSIQDYMPMIKVISTKWAISAASTAMTASVVTIIGGLSLPSFAFTIVGPTGANYRPSVDLTELVIVPYAPGALVGTVKLNPTQDPKLPEPWKNLYLPPPDVGADIFDVFDADAATQFAGWTAKPGNPLGGTLTINTYQAIDCGTPVTPIDISVCDGISVPRGGAAIIATYARGAADPAIKDLRFISLFTDNRGENGALVSHIDPFPNDDDLPWYYTEGQTTESWRPTGANPPTAMLFQDLPSNSIRKIPFSRVVRFETYLATFDLATKDATIHDGWKWGYDIIALCPAPRKAPKIKSLDILATAQSSDGCADFGDAPDSYSTLLNSDGPFYREGDLQRLGNLWETEPDGQPTGQADGDDKSILGNCACTDGLLLDDEDGVIFGDSWVDVIFNINRPDPNPYQLRAWWDTNYNGVFDHTSELYIDDLLTLAPGIFTKRYNLGFNPKADGLYSRFRLTWDPLDLDVKPFGEYYSKADCNTTDAAAGNCISHGEVEDYVHVPEPSSIFGLLAFGGLGLMGLRKKR